MRAHFATLLFSLMASLPLGAQPAGGHFPHLTAERLDKAKASLPGDFAGQLNILTLFFKRDQEDAAASWAPATGKIEAAHPGVKVYTIPVFERENVLSRWWTDASMRSTTKQPDWPTTIPLYVKRSEFLRALHVVSRDAPALLVLDRQGRVLWQTTGTANPAGEAGLNAAVASASGNR